MQGLRKVATSLVRIVCRAGVSLWLAYTSDVPRVRRGGCLAAGTQSYYPGESRLSARSSVARSSEKGVSCSCGAGAE